jgi:hypothetical protein
MADLLTCSICLETGCNLCLPCFHWVHRECFLKCHNLLCPECRKDCRESIQNQATQFVTEKKEREERVLVDSHFDITNFNVNRQIMRRRCAECNNILYRDNNFSNPPICDQCRNKRARRRLDREVAEAKKRNRARNPTIWDRIGKYFKGY